MDKIFLISSAAVGFVFGAVYAAVAKMLVQVAKAIISANQRVIQTEKAKANGHEAPERASTKTAHKTSHKASEKAKLPARIK
jgi:hypothetical protein